jgi:DNA-binding MarR family transcriptional regulator
MKISIPDVTALRAGACAKADDLTLRQIEVLGIISSAPAHQRTVRAMAAAMDVPKPVITRTADLLEEIGFARRRADTEDRRSIFLDVTPAGRAFAARHLVVEMPEPLAKAAA